MNTIKDLGVYISEQLNDFSEGVDHSTLEVYHAVWDDDGTTEYVVSCDFTRGGYVWVNKETQEAYYNEYGEAAEPPEEIKENYKCVYCIN